MFPRDLSTFHKVVLAGSIRKASAALGTAPSSISRKILILERQFGTPLFERTPTGLSLTHAGELVANYAKAAVLDFEALRADLDDLRGLCRRLIHVGTVESFVGGYPVAAVESFLRKFDSVTFKFTVLPAPQVPQLVARGECDIGLAFCSAPNPDILVLERVNEPVLAVMTPNHPLATKQSIELKDLEAFAVALPDATFRIRDLFEQVCFAANLRIAPTLISNSFASLKGFAEVGAGIAILPRGSVVHEERDGTLISLPLLVPMLNETTIDIIVRRTRLPRIVSLFANELRETIHAGINSSTTAVH